MSLSVCYCVNKNSLCNKISFSLGKRYSKYEANAQRIWLFFMSSLIRFGIEILIKCGNT